jgi:hypothetical protein
MDDENTPPEIITVEPEPISDIFAPVLVVEGATDEVAELPALEEDTFDLPELQEIAFEEAPEPGYYLYWYGEGDTSYWLSDQPLPDFNGVLVSGGDALYAKFGVLGTYMDMDLALGYGGMRPIDQAMTLHLEG